MTDVVINWFSNKIEELDGRNENLEAVLVELKSGVSALDSDSLQSLVREVNINPIFNSLNSKSSESVAHACDLLYTLLEQLSIEELLSKYGQQVQQTLSNTLSCAKITILNLLQKHVSVQSLLYMSTHQPELLRNVIECLPCGDRSIAEGAVQFFKKIGKCNHGVQILFAPEFVEILKGVMANSDICRFRVYEIVVDVSVYSPTALLSAHNSGILPSLLSELKSPDTLIQLNALELLTTLTAERNGLLYLQREGAIAYLVGRIANIQEEPLSFIVLPGLIEFFGNLYKLQPKVFSQQHPEVLSLLLQYFDTVDPALLGVVISTLAKIGFTDDGKKVLLASGDGTLKLFKRLGELIRRKDDLALVAMNSLSVLLKPTDVSLSEATLSWFDALGSEAMEAIVGNAKLPFIELRLSALELIYAICSQNWGAQKTLLHPGLIEFLLNRSAEFDKNCKNVKYDIIKLLASNQVSSEVIPVEVAVKLKQFISDGPFYVATEPEMAFDGAS